MQIVTKFLEVICGVALMLSFVALAVVVVGLIWLALLWLFWLLAPVKTTVALVPAVYMGMGVVAVVMGVDNADID